MNHRTLTTAILAGLLNAPLIASAESNLATGNNSAQARLDLQVTIPRVVFLAVGTSSTGLGNNATVDQLSFNIAANDVGSGTPTPEQQVAVRVFGNDGQVTLSTSATVTHLVSGADTIPLSAITVTSSDNTLLPPSFGGGSSLVTATNGSVTDRSATWRFAYANNVTPAAGTYEATVTYTAALP